MDLLSNSHDVRSSTRVWAFPIRLERGLFETTDEREAYLMLLGIMARTPRGSWSGHPSFGFNEFFAEVSKDGLTPEQRLHIADAAVREINSVLADLGLTRYRVDSLMFEPDEEITAGNLDGPRRWNHLKNERGATLMLRETDTDRAIRCSL